jgi:hypothetical protein
MFAGITGALAALMVFILASFADAQTCSFTTSPTIVQAGHAGGTYTVNFTASDSACNWVVGTTEDWITVTSATRGTGSGAFTITVKPNTGNEARQGRITFRREYVWVDQQAEVCTYTLTRSQYTLPHHNPFTLGLGVKTNKPSCSWSIEETADWISVAPSSPKSGSGDGNFSLMFTQNTSSASRTADVKIGGATLTITQPGQTSTQTTQSSTGTGAAAAGCSFNLSRTSHNAGSGNVRGTFSVRAGSGCNWTATTKTGWISIVSGSSGSGNGTVIFTVEANSNNEERTGHISVAGQTFSVIQKGYKASAKDRRHM